jgi:hypothetical protein
MNAKALFRQTMRERRQYDRASPEYQWRTRAARKFVWIIRDVPPAIWAQMEVSK